MADDGHNLEGLLKLYLGQNAGQAVADGNISRGDALKVTAAILLADIRNSTPMVRSLGLDAYIAFLNRTFDRIAPAVSGHGGEILQFTGDGLLAVFEETPEARSAGIVCPIAVASAFDAAQEANAATMDADDIGSVAFGLSYGVVAYGNVGAAGRLTFTVVGAEVSRADRLQRLCPIDGSNIALSETFFGALPEGCALASGMRALKGFDDAEPVYIPA